MIRMNTITAPAINLAIKRGGIAWRISSGTIYPPPVLAMERRGGRGYCFDKIALFTVKYFSSSGLLASEVGTPLDFPL